MQYNYFIDFADINLPEEFWDKYSNELDIEHKNNMCLVEIDYSIEPGQKGIFDKKPENCCPQIDDFIEIESYNIKLSRKLNQDCFNSLYLELIKHMENDINISHIENLILTDVKNKEY